jgi:hypothetical protein
MEGDVFVILQTARGCSGSPTSKRTAPISASEVGIRFRTQVTLGGGAVGSEGGGVGDTAGDATGVGGGAVAAVTVVAGDEGAGDEVEATGAARVQLAVRSSAATATILIARVTVTPLVR